LRVLRDAAGPAARWRGVAELADAARRHRVARDAAGAPPVGMGRAVVSPCLSDVRARLRRVVQPSGGAPVIRHRQSGRRDLVRLASGAYTARVDPRRHRAARTHWTAHRAAPPRLGAHAGGALRAVAVWRLPRSRTSTERSPGRADAARD